MIRTPTKTADAGEVSQAGASQACRVSTSPIRSVRRSVGEWEGQTKKPRTSPRSVVPAVKVKARALPKAVEPTPAPAAAGQSPKGDKPASADRIKEARACLTKAKLHLGSSRNLKTEIKEQVLLAINRLYELFKEAELAHRERTRDPKKGPVEEPASAANRVEVEAKNPPANPPPVSHCELLNKLDSHARLLEANTKELEGLRESLAAVKVQEKVKPPGTYASVTAGPAKRPPPGCEPKHSVAVSSGTDTGEQVLGKIRKALNATQTGIRVDRIRRVRDGRVILGCGTEAELERVREGLRRAGNDLNLAEVKNKDPLVLLRDVMAYNTNEEIIKAIKTQNKHLLVDVSEEDQRAEVRFRRRARNVQTVHVVMRVSPALWGRLMAAGYMHVDLQRVRVHDHSPLVQCTRCLGYGHTKRHCAESEDRCSHCGGRHLRAECPDRQAGKPPACRNCRLAKADRWDHGAFDEDCPVRRKWDTIARASVPVHEPKGSGDRSRPRPTGDARDEPGV
ncbi:uncharacterized protein [Battus philenor]|uniref:uncharacterized protein n=1 Tax=Battus philenor TaxID=42288 RepID=UPI0035D10C3A